ncbi:MAG: TetR-like C-terminal domain-containing protein [Solirubrobacteraceae bacterium]
MPRAGLDSEAVVEAAAELADASGFEAVTLAALADRLGIRAPSLYAHVASLADLRRRLRARAASELAAAVAAAAAGRAQGEALRAIANTYRDYAQSHPGLYAALQRAPEDPAAEDADAARRLLDVIVAVIAGYGLEGDDAIHGVRIVRAALHGFVSLEQLGGFAIELSLDGTFERLVAMLDLGLRSA